MRRLLIDVTRTLQSNQHTGIQRVVRSLLRALTEIRHTTTVDICAVIFENDRWHHLPELPIHPLESYHFSSFSPQDKDTSTKIDFLDIQPKAGDVILMADASWYLNPWPAVNKATDNGAQVTGFIHDLLPLNSPQWFKPELPQLFSSHLNQLISKSELLITPSNAVMKSLQTYIEERFIDQTHASKVTTQPLGADFFQRKYRPANIPSGGKFVLMVGTLEPRKNHMFILNVFEKIWIQGSELKLVLIGAPGWCSEELMERVQNHPELGQRLEWHPALPDEQLYKLYKHAQALVFPSLNEGFGLPIAEATYIGCPVIASDLPVHRETGAEWPTYLASNDIHAWMSALLSSPSIKLHGKFVNTWTDVASQLLQKLSYLPNTRKMNNSFLSVKNHVPGETLQYLPVSTGRTLLEP